MPSTPVSGRRTGSATAEVKGQACPARVFRPVTKDTGRASLTFRSYLSSGREPKGDFSILPGWGTFLLCVDSTRRQLLWAIARTTLPNIPPGGDVKITTHGGPHRRSPLCAIRFIRRSRPPSRASKTRARVRRPGCRLPGLEPPLPDRPEISRSAKVTQRPRANEHGDRPTQPTIVQALPLGRLAQHRTRAILPP